MAIVPVYVGLDDHNETISRVPIGRRGCDAGQPQRGERRGCGA
jgi:hypothetical protein